MYLIMLGPDERQTKQNHQSNLEDVVFNVFEDVTDNYTNNLTGFFLKLKKKIDSGIYSVNHAISH